MRFLTKIWLVLVAVALLHRAAWAASFTASLDRDTMTLGEQATLSLKFEGVQPQDAPGMPKIAGLALPIRRALKLLQLHQWPDHFQHHLQLYRDRAARRRVHHSRDAGECGRPAACFRAAEAGRDQGQRAAGRRRGSPAANRRS